MDKFIPANQYLKILYQIKKGRNNKNLYSSLGRGYEKVKWEYLTEKMDGQIPMLYLDSTLRIIAGKYCGYYSEHLIPLCSPLFYRKRYPIQKEFLLKIWYQYHGESFHQPGKKIWDTIDFEKLDGMVFVGKSYSPKNKNVKDDLYKIISHKHPKYSSTIALPLPKSEEEMFSQEALENWFYKDNVVDLKTMKVKHKPQKDE